MESKFFGIIEVSIEENGNYYVILNNKFWD